MRPGLKGNDTFLLIMTETPAIRSDGECLPIKSESVDLFFSTQTLEHVRDVPAFLREAKRVLCPSGIVIISTHWTYPVHADIDDWRSGA